MYLSLHEGTSLPSLNSSLSSWVVDQLYQGGSHFGVSDPRETDTVEYIA